ncbi:MAG: beta-L-arabinofuranosidase domain-containing protein [Planctomycetota bacterium]|jgi:DUF1680 family protein
MRNATVLSIPLVCLCAFRAFSEERAPAAGYAPRPVPIGYPLTPVPISEVKLREGFWSQRMKTHINVTVPHVLKTLKIDYAKPEPSVSQLALVRTLEGVAYCLMIRRDEGLEGMMDRIGVRIGEICRENPKHFLNAVPEAPVFHYFATAKASPWLKATEEACRRTRDEYFDDEGKPIKEPPPHAGIGMSVISLYRATGNEFYRDLARKFMDARGMPKTRGPRTWPKFAAQHLPVQEMNEPGGHAGSFGWFAAALVDVGALTGEAKYGDAAKRIWRNLVDTRICITGGTGAVSRWEGFGEPYAIGRGWYNETCAASGQVFWNHRLSMLTGDARYSDVMEVVLFNGLLAGVSIPGDTFFYRNILESDGRVARQPSRRVPCCHGSICRTIPQVPGYMYSHTESDIYVTLYAANRTTVPLKGGEVRVTQETKYPFDGRIVLELAPARDGQRFKLRLRIPAWAREKFMPGALYSFVAPPPKTWQVSVNGQPVEAELEKGFAVVERAWKSGDRIQLDLPMPVQMSTCIDKVKAYLGRVAVTRGPLVYCVEEADNNGKVQRLAVGKLPGAEQVKLSTVQDGILKGVTMVSFPGVERQGDEERPSTIHLVPYYSWCNRGSKSMNVWIPRGTKREMEGSLKWVPAAADANAPRSAGGQETAVVFENKTGRRVKIYWVGWRGGLRPYGELDPGETRRQNTYAGHTWQIADQDDKPLGHFIAGPQVSRAVIPDQE